MKSELGLGTKFSWERAWLALRKPQPMGHRDIASRLPHNEAALCVEPLSGYWDPATVPSCCLLFFHETISTDDAPAMHKLLNTFRKNQQGEGQGPREPVILKERGLRCSCRYQRKSASLALEGESTSSVFALSRQSSSESRPVDAP